MDNVREGLMALTITEASALIKARKLSPVELAKATIERSQQLNPVLKAFTTMTPEYALARAREAENEVMGGKYRGPLHGIPYTLKDIVATKGIRTTFGNPRLIDFTPAAHATVHVLLEDAGAVLLGKVYSHIGQGGNPVTCFSPWDPMTSPGTSSSGSGAAVSSGLGLFSIGSDTGGSVRHPASNCGIVGLKATFGRISRFGVWASSWSSDQAGPLAKTAEDTALLLGVLGAYDPKDLVSINEDPMDYTLGMKDGVRGLKIGVPTDNWVWKEWINQDEEDAVHKAIGVLQELGAEVVDIAIPLAYESRNNSLAAEGPVWLHDNFSAEALKEWTELHPQLQRGEAQTFAEYLHSQYQRMAIKQEINEVFRKVDLVAMPTGNTIGDQWNASTAVIRGREVPARSRAVYLNGLASQTGLPAMSVPCGFAKGGRFPVGLQLLGKNLDEGTLLRVGYAYQQATDWHTKHPKI
ncbi:MAG: amidase [Chloroflexi bacterium]|nr:amidase [Chloroflexota bacterium]